MAASLEDIISAKLAAMGLDNEDNTTFILGIIEEDSFEPEDKKSAILGMLEAEEDEAVGQSIDELLEQTSTHREAVLAKEREEEELRLAAEKEKEAAKTGKKVLTPEEEAARKAELLKTYGYIEEEEQERAEQEKKQAESDAPFVDPRTLSKKARKKAEAGIDIYMQPNMNASNVKNAEAQKRKDDSMKAAAKREKDKNDLKKQNFLCRDDAAKKLADKQKKAQKVERKG
ncbi:hypothetical protein BCR35DRAFT_323713 [Leucosporidium creatinivorum]|uniref:Coiled-coil domain-containing protein 43 n=1 Tax=Leucosporidium creatinivorum TaxID=106004 RepID=A0A1Y2G4U7_9BASI|nr:hypothetical protein BCR35DRAFT_323713 [Leucosporidium creatinivorum]